MKRPDEDEAALGEESVKKVRGVAFELAQEFLSRTEDLSFGQRAAVATWLAGVMKFMILAESGAPPGDQEGLDLWNDQTEKTYQRACNSKGPLWE